MWLTLPHGDYRRRRRLVRQWRERCAGERRAAVVACPHGRRSPFYSLSVDLEDADYALTDAGLAALIAVVSLYVWHRPGLPAEAYASFDGDRHQRAYVSHVRDADLDGLAAAVERVVTSRRYLRSTSRYRDELEQRRRLAVAA